MKLTLSVVGAALLIASCLVRANAAETLVFIVSYHNVDYARTSCNYVLSMEPDAVRAVRDSQKLGWGEVTDETTKQTLAGAAECRSVRDTRALGRRLENDLIDALAVEPLCGGISM